MQMSRKRLGRGHFQIHSDYGPHIMIDASTFWSKAAPGYAKSPVKDMASYEHTLERTVSYLSPDHSVLEIGCGTGTTALHLAQSGARIVATDLAQGMIDIAREKGADTPNVDFAVNGIADAPAGPFDVICAFNLLHLVEDIPTALAEMKTRLKPGGLLITKSACIKGSMPLIRLVLPVMQWVGKAPFVNYLTVEELDAMFVDAGFEMVETGVFPKKPPARFVVARA